MFNFIKKFFDENKKELKKILPIVQKINDLEPEIKKLSDEELFNKTEEFRSRLKKGETLDDILVEAFAVVREVSFRNAEIRQYDVQLMSGIFLHKGYISEMRTGEGKTHMAILAVYLNALEEKGVHVITVNDYLARRDAV
jgi:preprotein translocase subunit SecA